MEQVHFVYLLRILFAKPEINRPDVFAEPPVSHSTDCQPCNNDVCFSDHEDCFSGNTVDHVDMPPYSSESSMFAKISVYQRAVPSFRITVFKNKDYYFSSISPPVKGS